jgi:hypothetical protein
MPQPAESLHVLVADTGIVKSQCKGIGIVLRIVSRLRDRTDIDESRYAVCVEHADELIDRPGGVPNRANDRFLHSFMLDYQCSPPGLRHCLGVRSLLVGSLWQIIGKGKPESHHLLVARFAPSN